MLHILCRSISNNSLISSAISLYIASDIDYPRQFYYIKCADIVLKRNMNYMHFSVTRTEINFIHCSVIISNMRKQFSVMMCNTFKINIRVYDNYFHNYST